MKTHYEILGIEESLSPGEIKKAYRNLAVKYHPDKPDGDEDKFKEVNESYEFLKVASKRVKYDCELESQRAAEKAKTVKKSGNLERCVQKTIVNRVATKVKESKIEVKFAKTEVRITKINQTQAKIVYKKS
jgi:curved DNA-binding protein CbpA